MTAHYGRCRKAFWGLTVLLVFQPNMVAVQVRADDPAPKEITVNVEPGHSYGRNVGAGFDLIDRTATQLNIHLWSDKGTIVKSEKLFNPQSTIWFKVKKNAEGQEDPDGTEDETHWRCTGIGPNDHVSCIIKCTMAYDGGGSGIPERWMSISDVDFDADTDNNNGAAHRPPTQCQDEDFAEWPVYPTTTVLGLVIPLNDSNHVSWSQRDWGSPMSYAPNYRDVLNAPLTVNPRKCGEWTLIAGCCKRYTEDGTPVQEAERRLNMYWDDPLNLRLETLANRNSGERLQAIATFIPDDAVGTAVDKMWGTILGCDIDVDSDNDGTIAGSNGDGTGEDFFENYPSSSPLYSTYPEYKSGMFVGVNDIDDNDNGHPDNGWNGTDWSGQDGDSIENVDRFGIGQLQPLNVVDETVAALLRSQNATLQIKKLSGDGAVRLFDASGTGFNGVFANDGTAVTDATQSGWFRHRQYVTNLWVEGLRAGEVELAYQLYVNNILIHEDTVRVTVVKIDLDVDSNNDGTIDSDDTGEELYEPYASGVVVCKDRAGDGAGLDHLVEMKLGLSPGLTVGTVTASVSGSCLQAWPNSSKTGTPITYGSGKTWDLATESVPSSLWIDGLSIGQDWLELSYKDTNGNVVATDRVAVQVVDTISWSPEGTFAYAWEPCKWPYGTPGRLTSEGVEAVLDNIMSQGWNVTTCRFSDTTAYDDTFGTCTLPNFKSCKAGGVLVVFTHGSATHFSAAYASSPTPTGSWANLEPGMSWVSSGYWGRRAKIEKSWLSANWKPTRDSIKGITCILSCGAATAIDSPDSLAENAGGRVIFGYAGCSYASVSAADFTELFGRMNGSLAGGLKRTAGKAFDGGTGYHAGLRMFGGDAGYWTTLNPAPNHVFPNSSVANRKGAGCIVFDTYMAQIAPDIAVTVGSGSVSSRRWFSNGSGVYGISFDFDKTGGGAQQLHAEADVCTQESNQRRMAGDRHTYGSDKDWSF